MVTLKDFFFPCLFRQSLFCQLYFSFRKDSEPKIALHIFVTAAEKATTERLDRLPKSSWLQFTYKPEVVRRFKEASLRSCFTLSHHFQKGKSLMLLFVPKSFEQTTAEPHRGHRHARRGMSITAC